MVYGQIADQIRASVEGYTLPFPAILEIPSKDHAFGKHTHSSTSIYLPWLIMLLYRSVKGFSAKGLFFRS
jgi:hypothetical protein